MTGKTSCIILAGGMSRRMGEDKAFMSLSGKPLIKIIIDNLSDIFDEVIVVTNKPHLYERFGVILQRDILENKGPLGGIHAGLTVSGSKYSFAAACDMPFINKALAGSIVKNSSGYDAVACNFAGRMQPLCAVYSKECIAPIEEQLAGGCRKTSILLTSVRTNIVPEVEVKKFDPDGRSFLNINTKEDYKCILKEPQTSLK